MPEALRRTRELTGIAPDAIPFDALIADDRPAIVRGVTRVSGPFTVEAVQPPEMSLGDVLDTPEFAGAPKEVGPRFEARFVQSGVGHTPQDIAAYLDKMIKLLKIDGVRFPNNKQMTFTRLEPIF